MKTIVIQWESLNGGEIAFAHFPEPFPMTAAEFAAFEALFNGWRQAQADGFGQVRIADDGTPAALVAGLQRLGYSIEHRGDIPASIREGFRS